MTEYQSPFNKPSSLRFIVTQQSMEENEYGKSVKSGPMSIFTLLKHLMMLSKCNFFKASCLHLIKDTDNM